jgi:hypothetical protein
MDIETVIQTILEKSPGIKAKKLVDKVIGRTHDSRSTIYEHFSSLENQEIIERYKGQYWIKGQKPISTSESFAVEQALSHSCLLIPALERIAHSDFLADYENNIETVGSAFFNDKCAIEHLRAYPRLKKLYEQTKTIKKKAEATKAMNDLDNQIITKLKKQFGETTVIDSNRTVLVFPEQYIDVTLASKITFQIQSKTPIQSSVYKNELSFGGSYLAKGDGNFRAKLQLFVENEMVDKYNIKEIAKIEKSKKDGSKVISMLSKEIITLIMKIKHGRPLKGKCAICSGV